MGLTTAAVGGLVGFTAQMMSNAIQKIPLSRRKYKREMQRLNLPTLFVVLNRLFLSLFNLEPWMHVLCTLGGAWGAHKWLEVEKDMLADVNEIRANKGLPPMVGTHYFFPLVPPDFKSDKA